MAPSGDPRSVALSVLAYRALLAGYPHRFRQAYREEMTLVFRDSCRDAYRERGWRGLLVTWKHGLADLGTNMPQEVTTALLEETPLRPLSRTCSGCANEVASDWQTCRYCGMFLAEGTTYPTRITPERHTFRRNLDAYLDHYRTEGTPGPPSG